MSTTKTTATLASAFHELASDFSIYAERLYAELDEGKSGTDATRAATKAAQSKMLSGLGDFEYWPQTGRIDGAIDTEVGPIAFEGGKICGSEQVDIQSGPVSRWRVALTQVDHAIEFASDCQEPSNAVDTLSNIWAGLDNTTRLLVTNGQRVWDRIDPSVQPAVLGQVSYAFRELLALQVTVLPPGKCEQTESTNRIDCAWLARAMQMEATGRSEESLDIIFDKLDDWLLGGCFDACSSFLADAPVDELSTAQLLTILTATSPASTKLPARATFFDRVREMLRQRGDDADTLLSGLKA